MTPKSDHEDDMSMEEILASIRRFVTDSPPEGPKQKIYKGDLAESVVIPPAGHAMDHGQGDGYSRQPVGRQPHMPPPAYEPDSGRRPRQPPSHQPSVSTPQYEADVLELTSPALPTQSTPGSFTEWGTPAPSRMPVQAGEESIMTLTNPIDVKKGERPVRFSTKASQGVDQETTLSSSHAVAASANSLSRLAQTSKSVFHKKSSTLADQRDLTLDQLIQDMIRPMIKLWIDTHLPSLVEEMVAKEIKRITNHLK